MKEGVAVQNKALASVEFSTRLLTDVTGPFYTLVLELTVPSLATFESCAPRLFADKDWQANYQKGGAAGGVRPSGGVQRRRVKQLRGPSVLVTAH
jgi:hypothetical protein